MHLNNNKIKNIDGIAKANFKDLVILSLRDNNISDISILEKADFSLL